MALEPYSAVVAATSRRDRTQYTAFISGVSVARDGTPTVDVTYRKDTRSSPVGPTTFTLYVGGSRVANKTIDATTSGNVISLSGGRASGSTELRVTGNNPDLSRSGVFASTETADAFEFGRTIQAPELVPAFRITSVDYPTEAPVDERFNMTVTVRNIGTAEGAVSVGGDGPEGSANVLPDKEATVGGPVMLKEPGRRQFAIEATNEVTGRIQTITVPVIGLGPSIELAGVRFPGRAPASRPFTGSVVLVNNGTETGRATVAINGQRRTVTLSPRQSSVVEHEAPPDEGGDQLFEIVVEDPETGDRLDGATTRVRRSVNEYGERGLLGGLRGEVGPGTELSFGSSGPVARGLFGGSNADAANDRDS